MAKRKIQKQEAAEGFDQKEMWVRGKETFILVGDLVDPQYPTYAVDYLSFNINQKMPIFYGYVRDVMESNNLLKAIEGLDKMINEDQRLADHLSSDVVEHLVKILKESDSLFIQRSAAYILSRAKYEICRTIITEKAIPVLVDLMSKRSSIIAIPVVITLTRLACVSPDYVSVMLNQGALEAVRQIAGPTNWSTDMLDNLAKFMAIVCRGKLPLDKECLALTVLEELLQRGLFTFRHMRRTCYALQYLSYERPVEIKEETCKRLIRFIAHPDNAVVGSALGVLGNIARWGNSYQIEILANDPEFLRCLGTLLCCKIKKFQLEASQIISKIAAQSRTLAQDMHKSGLIKMEDESDIKMEVGCTISVASMQGYQHLLSQEICGVCSK